MTSLEPGVERFAEVNGVRLHYRISGEGSPVVLLHGYTQTGHMWHPIARRSRGVTRVGGVRSRQRRRS